MLAFGPYFSISRQSRLFLNSVGFVSFTLRAALKSRYGTGSGNHGFFGNQDRFYLDRGRLARREREARVELAGLELRKSKAP